MKVNGKQLNSYQANFIKELMGETFMSEVRASTKFGQVCAKYDVDIEALLEAINKNFLIKNKQFKEFEDLDA